MATDMDVTREEFCRHNANASYFKTLGIIWHFERGKISMDCLSKKPSVTTKIVSNYWASQ